MSRAKNYVSALDKRPAFILCPPLSSLFFSLSVKYRPLVSIRSKQKYRDNVFERDAFPSTVLSLKFSPREAFDCFFRLSGFAVISLPLSVDRIEIRLHLAIGNLYFSSF